MLYRLTDMNIDITTTNCDKKDRECDKEIKREEDSLERVVHTQRVREGKGNACTRLFDIGLTSA